jgi:signal transduction histidine kinase
VSLGERIASQLARALANAELHIRTVQLAEQETLRARLEVDNERLKMGNEVKAQLLSNVSHELRTPLTSVLSFAYSLRRNPAGNLSEPQLKQIDMIRRGGRILEMLISDLLAMSSLESGKFTINPDEFVLKDLITDVQAVADSIISTRNQTLEVDLKTPDATVFGDRDRLSQVLFNLINNASRYADDGTAVQLSAGVLGDDLVVSVKDQGIGITEMERASLFTRFFRADNETTRSRSGTGLGLFISRSIVEMHHGRIWVDSKPGEGSEFTFQIPAYGTKDRFAKSA